MTTGVRSPAVRVVDVERVRGEAVASVTDCVAVEEPLEIRLAQGAAVRRLAVTMRTPGDDADLAVGFLVGEGVVRQAAAVQGTRATPLQAGATDPNVIVVDLASSVSVDLSRVERHLYTTSSCGVCGKASLDAVRALAGPALGPGPLLSADAISAMPVALRAVQEAFEETGGLHAAALFTSDGALVRVREDVGRHNALDKLVGSYWREAGGVPAEHAVLVSGRASFELVQKAWLAGVSVLAAVGAPSSLAVDLAREADLTLLGFVRDGRFNVYSGAHRILDIPAAP